VGFRLLILIPIGLLLVVAAFRLAVGRALRKRTFDIVLALLLLGYFLATAGLGVFWVANQELPVFDWHYLLGYLTAVLVIVHVALNWKTLTAFVRKGAPKVLIAEGTPKWRPAVRTTAWIIGLAVYGGVFYWIGRGQGAGRIEITRVPVLAAEAMVNRGSGSQESTRTEPAPARLLQQQVVEADGEKRMLADYYHEETKHTRLSVVKDSGALNWSTKPEPFKPYPGAEVIDLPAPAEAAGMSVGAAIDACRRPVHGFAPDAVTLADLSTLLFMTNGVTYTLEKPGRTYYLRTAPSAGALYPTITYLIARNVTGLPPGVYHYAVDEHELHRLDAEEEAHERLASLVSSGHLVREAPVTFVFTSAFYRTSWKYRARSYRYCGLDAGHLAVQTALAAAALGRGSKPIGRFDDVKVNALLGLNENEEGAMLILPVGTVSTDSPIRAGLPEFALQPQELSGKAKPLVLLAHGSTCLGLTGDTVQPFPITEPADKPYPDLPVIALPGGLLDGDDLFATIARRRSIRNWADTGLTLDEFASVMHYAFGVSEQGSDALSDPSVEDSHTLNLYAIVNRVDELAPGVYYYRPRERALTLIRKGDHREQTGAASLFQDAVRYADIALVMTVDLARMGSPDGDRGYRYAALDAGMLGGRVYLQTTGLNLGCCGIGAYFDDEVSDLIGVSPNRELVIYLAAIGAPEPGAER
jgi:SagB-type dehydrogenase family enzyme